MNELKHYGWFALQVKPKEEKRAQKNLTYQDFESYFPKIYSFSKVIRKDLLKEEFMFPGYAFVKNKKNIDLKKLNSTRGIVKIVRFGTSYPLLSKDIIKSVMSIEKDSYKNPKQQSFKIGEKIIINTGPLKDHQGVIAGKEVNQRIEILYTLLNRAHSIQVGIENISKV
ncbi:MAG: hypothetical protein CMD68_01960 [Gammaproteobacteria bacterium]|nr:hypothetical protein [Gammaproteobacteria bacterium]